MKPTDVSNAITQALVQGGSQWLVSTVIAFLPVLWTMTLMLHLGRPYVLRTLRRCGLRLGADVWWMSYLLMRDGLFLVTLGVSLVFFQPNLVANSAFPITGPIAGLLLLLTLAVKLTRRVDDDINAYRLATVFLVLGATLYYGPLVFAVEATSQGYLSGFGQVFTSNANVNAALVIMWISLVGVILIAGFLFARAWMHAARQMQQKIAVQKLDKKESLVA